MVACGPWPSPPAPLAVGTVVNGVVNGLGVASADGTRVRSHAGFAVQPCQCHLNVTKALSFSLGNQALGIQDSSGTPQQQQR